MKKCLQQFTDSQKLIELISNNEQLLNIPNEFHILLGDLHIKKIKETIDKFLHEQYWFFEEAKKNQEYNKIATLANVLNEIPQYLKEFGEVNKFENFKSSLIQDIKEINQKKIIELWNNQQYIEIEKNLHFLDKISPISNCLSVSIPDIHPILSKLVRNAFNNEIGTDAEKLAKLFVEYRSIAEIIKCLLVIVGSEITKKVTEFSKNDDILALYTALKNQNSTFAEYVCSECPNFTSFKNKLINEKRTFSAANTLEKITKLQQDGKYSHLDAEKIGQLKHAYLACEKKYNELLRDKLGTRDFHSIVNKVLFLVEMNGKKHLVEIIANIFALWSLTNSELDFIKKTNELDYFKKPHPVQMLSVFMLLSFDNPAPVFENQLIEIKTGEGKSITLGVCAIFFALMGYEIDVVCYSKILSSRDENDFKNLFDSFNVAHKIHYNTIDNLYENIINEQGNFPIREKVKNFISNQKENSNSNTQDQPTSPRICLIDEVDEFCSKLFLGRTYTPISVVQDDDFFEIIQLIWNHRHNSNSLTVLDIHKENSYKKLIKRYPDMVFIFNLQIQELLNDVNNFDDPELPEFHFNSATNKIGYKHHDEIDYDIYLKHKTTFRYFDQLERQLISNAILKSRVGFYICCGRFSFAQIPSNYVYLLGLTGTLNLHETQIQVVNNRFKIKNFTKMPSMYGESQLKFDKRDDLCISSDLDEYYLKLQTEIKKALHEQRAILVFFENEARLNSFKQSSYCPDSCQVIVESSSDKNTEFRKATRSGSCTLLTKVFGRGTDFSVKDKNVISNNGVLVIQTFFSDSFSEEVQIKGRTARQGYSGQFMIILLKSDILTLFGFDHENPPDFKSASELYEQLCEWRIEKTTNDLDSLTSQISAAHKLHNISQNLKTTLRSGSSKAWKDFNSINNSFFTSRATTKPFNIIMALDESYSMKDDWAVLINAVQEFIQSRIGKCNQMGISCNDVITIMCYDDEYRTAVEKTELTNPKLPDLINGIKMEKGGTEFGPIIAAANVEFSQSDLNSFIPVFVFMTDGHSKSGDAEMIELQQNYEQNSIQIFVIGFGAHGAKNRLETLAELGKTKAVFGETGDLLKEEFVRVSAKISEMGPLKQ